MKNGSVDSRKQTLCPPPPTPPLFAIKDVLFISWMWAVRLCNSLAEICDIFLKLFQPFFHSVCDMKILKSNQRLWRWQSRCKMTGFLLCLVKFLTDVVLPADSLDEGTAERGQRNKRRVLGTNSVGEPPRRPTFLLPLPFCSASKFSLTLSLPSLFMLS